MKKKFYFLFFLVILLTGCSKKITINNYHKESSFTGLVKEVREQSLLIDVNKNEDEFLTSDIMIVSLDVLLKDSLSNFTTGDKVRIYYDGNIAESYPGQINNVYAIDIINPINQKKDKKKDFSSLDLIPSAMLDNQLYLAAGYEALDNQKNLLK